MLNFLKCGSLKRNRNRLSDESDVPAQQPKYDKKYDTGTAVHGNEGLQNSVSTIDYFIFIQLVFVL